MKRVYQRIVDKGHGDCMQASVASLFEDEYENVPNFIEHENWFDLFETYIKSKGYEFDGMLHNMAWNILSNPTRECFEYIEFVDSQIISKLNIDAEPGVEGLFLCSVLSPKYFTWEHMGTHMVICDREFNIVHDPNKEYRDIEAYPLSSILGYHGIINITTFKKI